MLLLAARSGCFPPEEEFLRLAAHANVIPVFREVIADLDTPISAYAKLGGGMSFLLESAEGGERVGRYSFIGYVPTHVLAARGGATDLLRHAGGGRFHREATLSAHPLLALREAMQRFRPARVPGLPRFFGGAVGYCGYDIVRHLERLPGGPRVEPRLPEAMFMVTERVVIFDHLTRRVQVVANAFVDGDARASYRRAVAAIEETQSRLLGPAPAVMTGGLSAGAGEAGSGACGAEYAQGLREVPGRERFIAAVERAKEYIRAGEIFQVVLSVRREQPLRVAPFQVYRALRALNPSPYLFFLDFGDLQLIGSSPEMLVRVAEDAQGNKVVQTRPIAGTRPRGRDAEEDAALERELLSDAKERAEHVMLVDLGRNDVGRVSRPGTVRVTDLMRVERYSHVMHIVSDVEGHLRPDCDAIDALAACFPAGTLTGAPKVRAMEIIDELEPLARGPYGGCVGYLGFTGNLDACITIRTVVASGGKAYVQAGAGIVADSVPAREWEECQNKMRALVRALEMAEDGLLARVGEGDR